MNIRFLATTLLAIAVPTLLPAQGPLTPPTTAGPAGPIPALSGGAPQASMKTLHEVQPSTAVNATNTPGDASNLFIISQSGAYHLTGNVLTFGQSGIKITSPGVTLDLNGFELWSFNNDPAGIEIGPDADRCTIRNGSIRDFAFGVNAVLVNTDRAKAGSLHDLSVTGHSFIALNGGPGWTIDRCRVHEGGNTGISTGDGSVVTNCSVRDMIGTIGTNGIRVGKGSVVQNCSVTNCKVQNGFTLLEGSVIENCSATGNQGDTSIPGLGTYGIFATSRCLIRNCVANENTHSGSAFNQGAGIYASSSSSVINCHANKNDGAGIIIDQACTVESCKAHFNGHTTGNNGAGIHVRDFRQDGTEGWNRIIDNDLTFNDTGIDCDTDDNFIVRNRAGGNGENYNIVGNNRVGPIVIPFNSGPISGSGSGQASGVGTTDPWANFTY